MNQQLNAHAYGLAGAIVSATGMLLLGIGANIGIYENAAAQMQKWHLFFSPSFMGIIGGMIEAAVISYVFLYAFVWVYDWLLEDRR